MDKFLRFLFTTMFLTLCGVVFAVEKKDELTWSSLGLSSNSSSYADFGGKTFSSVAVYAGNATSGSGKYIQLRSVNGAGIVTTVSGGVVKSVTFSFNEALTTERTIDVYGKTEAYTASSDLYNTSKRGTKLGSVKNTDKSHTLNVTGDYTYIGLRSNNGAVYIDTITIVWEYAEAAVATPTFSPGTGVYTTTQAVSINCETEGASIYYTTDGTDPDATKIPYRGPINVSETTTVKAIAIKGTATSNIATSIYTFASYADLTIAQACELTETTDYVNLIMNNAKIVYVDGSSSTSSSIYVRENGKAIMFYNAGVSQLMKLNATVSGSIKGKFVKYRDLINEIYRNNDTNKDNLVITESEDTKLAPTPATLADILDKKYVCDLVELKNVKLVTENDSYFAVDGKNKVELYPKSAIKDEIATAVDDNNTHTLIALFNSIYMNDVQIKPVAIDVEAAGIKKVNTGQAKTAIYNLSGQRVTEDYKGIVIKNGKKYIFN
ncbi:MAG: chitobiase/beta-hexosaminidase C-terminal domain-containing protein [Prevotella sp.]|nr:chitobiase/beta-hexosaminidase C-terminal domain-containing protein [Prevotella sp.]